MKTNEKKPYFTLLEALRNAQKEGSNLLSPTRIADLDRLIGGFRAGDLVTLAARPSVGKSALMTTLATNLIVAQEPCVCFSLEMTNTQIVKRLSGSSSLEDLENQFKSLPLFLNDENLNFHQISEVAKLIKENHNLKVVFIDYLQMIAHDGNKSNHQYYSIVCKSLKALAKELKICVVLLSQLNRDSETKDSKMPTLANLRGSGTIEEVSDVVLMLYRPEYHGILQDELGESTKGKAQLFVLKNRNGRTGKVELKFNSAFACFEAGENKNF